MIKWKLIAALAATTIASCGSAAQPISPPTGAAPPRLVSGGITNMDYPAAAIRAREQGNVRIALNIGVDGAVTDCAVTTSSGSEALDSATCAIARERFRFTPGRTSDGLAAPSVYRQSVRWVLPDVRDGNPFGTFSVALTATLRDDGEIVSCTGQADGEDEPAEVESCRAMLGRWPGWDIMRSSFTQVSHVFAFTPEGSSPEPYSSGWGAQLISTEIELLIGPDGRTIGCGEPGGAVQRPCPAGSAGVPQFQSSPEPERRGRLMIALFGIARR